MLIGQQVRVTGERGPLRGLVGTVEEAFWEEGRSSYAVRLEHPHHTTLYWFKVSELARTSYCYMENEHPNYERVA